MRGSARLVLVLGVTLALGGSLAAAAGPTPVTFAISDDAAQRAFPSELTSARSIGIGAARAYVGWAEVATRRPAKPRDPADPAYDWKQTDADMARYEAAGLQVWIAFWRTPAWASGSSDPAVWPTDPADLGDFAYAAAKRYPQVQVFMDWNEPNLKLYAKPNTIAAYEPMARAVYAGVKAAHPGAELIAGNLGKYRDNGRDPADWATALHADGVPMDALGIHPYPEDAKPLSSRAPRLRIDLFDVPALARLAGVPVAVTEFGWSSELAGAQNQAAWTAQAIDVARCTPGLAQFVFWGYHDHPVPLGQVPDRWVRYGWLDATGIPKPVYATASAALAGTPDCTAVAQSAGAPAGWPQANAIPPTDRAPVCSAVAIATAADASASADVACVDPDGDALHYTVATPPAGGTLAQAGSLFTYTPVSGFAGTETFTVAAGDGTLTTPFAFTVSVAAPVLPPPVVADAPVVAAPVEPPPAAAAATIAAPAVLAPAAARPRGRATLQGRRIIAIELACPGTAASCSGTVSLTATWAGAGHSLGRRAVTLAAGRSSSVRLTVPDATRTALRRVAGRSVTVHAVFVAAGLPRASSLLPLRVPR